MNTMNKAKSVKQSTTPPKAQFSSDVEKRSKAFDRAVAASIKSLGGKAS